MTIVIDAGHGGSGQGGDPGATGPCGAQEKDVTLSIAKMLHERLPGSVLTRSEDTYVDLSKRAEFANGLKADLFVSVHCNGHESTRAEGIETFHHPSSESGHKLATAIQGALTERFSEHYNRGVKTARFKVLVETKMPAVLVETEFITSKWCQFLTREEVQREYADAIARGIRRYLGQPDEEMPIYRVVVDGGTVGAYRDPIPAMRIALAQGPDKIVIEKAGSS